jgi:anti-sigma-K factor RskA
MQDHENNYVPKDYSELLAGYVLGDLTPTEVGRVKATIEREPYLQQEVEALQATLALLPLALPETLPIASLRTQILETAETHAVATTILYPHRRFPFNFSRRWAAVAGVSILGAAGWLGYHQVMSDQIARTNLELDIARSELKNYRSAVALLRQPDSRLMTIRGTTGLHQTAAGNLAIDPQGKAAVLTLQQVPRLPKDRVYRMWAFVNGKKVSCIDFRPDAKGQVFLNLPQTWGETTTAIVTIESARQTPAPTGPAVMNGGNPI